MLTPYYKAKSISKQIDHSIPALCYVGEWSTTKGPSTELHKFWSCNDNLNRCVGGTKKKHALDRLALLSLWLVQVGTNFIQIEVVALEHVNFLLSKKPRCPLIHQVGDNTSTSPKLAFNMCPSKFL
jgi:hypothetical protein